MQIKAPSFGMPLMKRCTQRGHSLCFDIHHIATKVLWWPFGSYHNIFVEFDFEQLALSDMHSLLEIRKKTELYIHLNTVQGGNKNPIICFSQCRYQKCAWTQWTNWCSAPHTTRSLCLVCGLAIKTRLTRYSFKWKQLIKRDTKERPKRSSWQK